MNNVSLKNRIKNLEAKHAQAFGDARHLYALAVAQGEQIRRDRLGSVVSETVFSLGLAFLGAVFVAFIILTETSK